MASVSAGGIARARTGAGRLAYEDGEPSAAGTPIVIISLRPRDTVSRIAAVVDCGVLRRQEAPSHRNAEESNRQIHQAKA